MTVASPRSAKIETMMTQQLHVSILAAPLAAIDPRALSQAWYSALRLAHGAPGDLANRRPLRDRCAPASEHLNRRVSGKATGSRPSWHCAARDPCAASCERRQPIT